jgi:hypothetical protein
VDAPELDLTALLTGAQAALYARVSVKVIVNWRNRGHLPVAIDEQGREIRDSRNRPLYRLLDVAKADAKTRERAGVMAGRLAARAAAA